MPDLTLIVGGMTCAGCAHRVTEALEGAPGVASADVPGWESGRADVALDAAAPADPADLVSAVEAAGYRAAVDGGAPPAPPANGPASGYGAPADEQPEPSGDGAPSSTPLLSDLPTDAYDLVVVGGGSAALPRRSRRASSAGARPSSTTSRAGSPLAERASTSGASRRRRPSAPPRPSTAPGAQRSTASRPQAASWTSVPS